MEHQKRSFWSDMKKFFEPVKAYKRSYLRLIAWVSIRPLWSIVTTLMLAKAVWYLQANNSTWFFHIILGYTIFVVVYQIYNFFLRNAWQRLSWDFYYHLWKKYLTAYVKLESNSTETIGTGKMLSIMDKWIDMWVAFLMEITRQFAATVLQFLFVTYILARIGWYFPVLFYVFIVCIFLLVTRITRISHKFRWIRNDIQDDMTRQNVKAIMSKFEILMNNKIEIENSKLEELVHRTQEIEVKKHFYEHIGFNIPTVSIACITIWLFLFLGYQYFYQGSINYASVVLYLWVANALDSGTRSAITVYQNYVKYFQRITKLQDTFEEIPEIIWYNTWNEFTYKKGNISFHEVSFTYGDTKVLDKFSCELSWSKKTAFVGISGGWKSTLIKLIAGYLHPIQWHIIVDGQELPTSDNLVRAISLKSYYKHIGYLTQEPNVFDGTIYDNLTYALDYTPWTEELDKAIEQAQCQFIYEFKDKLQTEIWEKWVRLSWWQRQRLAIAKIFLKNPEIVLLDEPTSALDSMSEEAITKAMHNLFEGRTVIVIAHRLQTVKHADDIIVLEQWKVIERGTHHELVKQGGHYAKMLELQSWF